LIVAEAHVLIMRRAGIAAALRFVQMVRASPNVVVSSNPRLDDAAVNDWLMRYADQPFSMVDAVSFAIMAERGTHAALTLDRHFATAGYEIVTHWRREARRIKGSEILIALVTRSMAPVRRTVAALATT
jgi:predicted nucleic acid-binding protein